MLKSPDFRTKREVFVFVISPNRWSLSHHVVIVQLHMSSHYHIPGSTICTCHVNQIQMQGMHFFRTYALKTSKNADTSSTIHCLFLWFFWEVQIFRIIQDQPIAALGYDSGCLQRVVSFRGCWSSTCTCLGLPKSGLVLLHLLHALDNDARICS